jgi:hypothetical protein
MSNARLQFEPVRSSGFAAILAGYSAVGTPTQNAAVQFLIQNFTDQSVMFSFDGVNDHFPLPSDAFFLDDISSNSVGANGLVLPAGSVLYVKQLSGAPGSGSVYFTVAY